LEDWLSGICHGNPRFIEETQTANGLKLEQVAGSSYPQNLWITKRRFTGKASQPSHRWLAPRARSRALRRRIATVSIPNRLPDAAIARGKALRAIRRLE
jgi:hypothetical protein